MSKHASNLLGVKRPVSRTLRKYMGLLGDGWTIRDAVQYGVSVFYHNGDAKFSAMLEDLKGVL